MSTQEQRDARARLLGQVAAADARWRVIADAEGWPLIPGRYGQVEDLGLEWATGEYRLYVFTPTPRMIPKLRAMAGVHPSQIGDTDARFWFPSGDPALLRSVCALIRARVRRPETAPVPTAYRFTTRSQDQRSPPDPYPHIPPPAGRGEK
jgi:hypothetical protein